MHTEVPAGKQINGFTGELEDMKPVTLQMSDIEQRLVAVGDMKASEVKDPADYVDPEGRDIKLGETLRNNAPKKEDKEAARLNPEIKKEDEKEPVNEEKKPEAKEKKRETVSNSNRSRTTKR